jgi:hypothetical protein
MTDEVATLIPPAPPPPSRRNPADDLPIRQTLLRRLGEPPTAQQLKRHADRFGSEFVVQTATEVGYGVETCVMLSDHCDIADLARLRRDRPNARLDRRAPSDDRVRKLLGLDREEV